MACRFTYAGKTYSEDEFRAVIKAMPLDEAAKYVEGIQSIPSAPFVEDTNDWVSLALKAILHKAAVEGYDSVAWTTGDQQAARYDLSKQVKEISVVPRTDARTGERTREVNVFIPNGARIQLGVDANAKVDNSTTHAEMVGKSLDDVIGKEMAEKVMAVEDQRWFRGLDLKVGGEGMKAFYDRIVPQVAQKLGKKFGATVQDLGLKTEKADRKLDKKVIADAAVRFINGDDDAKDFIERADLDGLITEDEVWALGEKYGNNDRGDRRYTRALAQNMADEIATPRSGQKRMTVHSISISPSMRASVKDEGFPLFARNQKEMTEKDWAWYNGLSDDERAAKWTAALKKEYQVKGARRGVVIADFEADVHQSVIETMQNSPVSTALAKRVDDAVRLISRVAGYEVTFGGFTPAGNLHGVLFNGKIYLNYLATKQLAVIRAKKKGISFDRAFGEELALVLIHEYAHKNISDHGDEHDAEMFRLAELVGDVGINSIIRDAMLFAKGKENNVAIDTMSAESIPGWIRGEERGRQAAEKEQEGQRREHGGGFSRKSDGGASSEPGADSERGEGTDGPRVRREEGLQPVRELSSRGLAGGPGVRGADGRIVPQFGAGDPRRNASFREWFGDSKATHEDGAPMVLYHGSPTGGFTVFDTERQGSKGGFARGGFSFTNDLEAAESYAESFSDETIAIDEIVGAVNKVWRTMDNKWNEALAEEFGGDPGEPAPEWVWDAFDDGVEDARGQVREAAKVLKRLGFLEEAAAMRKASDVGVHSSPEVYRVYLKVPPESPEFTATRKTLAEVVSGLDVRTVPGRAAVVNLPDGEKIFYVADSSQIKRTDNAAPTDSPDIRFSRKSSSDDRIPPGGSATR